jgi:hypothetical protein
LLQIFQRHLPCGLDEDEELPVIRFGRRILIPAVAPQALLETSQKSRS